MTKAQTSPAAKNSTVAQPSPTAPQTSTLPIDSPEEGAQYLLEKEFDNSPDIATATVRILTDNQGTVTAYVVVAHAQSIRENGGSGTLGTYLVEPDGGWGLTDPSLLLPEEG